MLIKNLWIFVFLLVIGISNIQANELNTLKYYMEENGVDTALIVNSQAIDEYPLWSDDGKYITVNVAGKWYKINIQNITLEKTTWRNNQPLGVLTSQTSISSATFDEVKKFKKATIFKPRKYQTKKGTKLELKLNGLGTEFLITKKGANPIKKWSSKSENCHSLSSNSLESYIAFICELNGVFVFKMDE